MKNSKALIKAAGVIPRLRLGSKSGKGVASTGPHKVKILEDHILRLPDPQTGKDTEFVRYIVEENGEKKRYDTRVKDKSGQLSYLVQRLAEIPEGGEVILEMKRAGVKNYVDVRIVGDVETIQVDEHDEEIPEEGVIQ